MTSSSTRALSPMKALETGVEGLAWGLCFLGTAFQHRDLRGQSAHVEVDTGQKWPRGRGLSNETWAPAVTPSQLGLGVLLCGAEVLAQVAAAVRARRWAQGWTHVGTRSSPWLPGCVPTAGGQSQAPRWCELPGGIPWLPAAREGRACREGPRPSCAGRGAGESGSECQGGYSSPIHQRGTGNRPAAQQWCRGSQRRQAAVRARGHADLGSIGR